MSATSPTHLYRGDFAEIIETSRAVGVPAPVEYKHAKELLKEAFETKVLPKPYFQSRSRNRFDSLNYDIYDFMPSAVLVQQRFASSNARGTRTWKDYYIVTRDSAKGITVELVDQDKRIVVRTARSTDLEFGLVLGRLIHRRESRKFAAMKRKPITP